MKSIGVLIVAALLASAAASTVFAHPFTVKGTVVSAEPARIAIRVIDEKTKKPEIKTFAISDETVILRGDKVVTFARARIKKGEPVGLTANVDDRDEWAEVIRLPGK
jgi:hypothetical protein